MTLGSKIVEGKKIYSLDLTEKEFNDLTETETPIRKFVEWAGGRAKFILQYKKIG